MDLLRKAKKFLKEAFPAPDQVKIRDEDGLIGFVTSSRFRGMDSIERQSLLWDTLDKKLTPEERKKVVIIITITPEEYIGHLSTS